MSAFPTDLLIHKGRCTLFFGAHQGKHQGRWKCCYSHSDDSGHSWSPPIVLPKPLCDNTYIRDSIITRDGRIMLAFQHYLGCTGRPGDRPCIDPRNGVAISSDGGETWSVHGMIRTSDDDQYDNWAEPSLVELGDGTISMLIRAQQTGVLLRADSKDGGLTWPERASRTDIPNPGSKFTLYSLGDDTVAILHNPSPKNRNPLSLWVSFDGMRTWSYRRTLLDKPGARLAYPDGFVSKDKSYLHFAFDDTRRRAVYVGAKLPPLRQDAQRGEKREIGGAQ
jgi:predicted neuraminidase